MFIINGTNVSGVDVDIDASYHLNKDNNIKGWFILLNDGMVRFILGQ